MSRLSQRRNNRNSKNSKDIKGIILIGIVIFLVSGLLLVMFIQKQSLVKIDKNSHCPLEGPSSLTAVIIDATDNINLQQKQAIINEFNIIMDDIPKYGRLDLYLIQGISTSLLRPTVSVCNPGDGQDIDVYVGNKRKVQKVWQEAFVNPLESALNNLINMPSSSESPILETIQSVALTSLSEKSLRDKKRVLILVSDLMQHTKKLSFFKNQNSTDKVDELKADLSGVDVKIWQLQRFNAVNQNQLIDKWQKIFASQEANQVSLCVLVQSNRCNNGN